MIEKIKKELEKIPTTKEKIKFLMIKLKEIDDKKIRSQIEAIVNQLIEQENLEDRVEIRQEHIETNPLRPAVSVLEDQLPTLVPRRKQLEEESEKVDYKISTKGSKYEPAESLEVESGNPLEQDKSHALNLTPLKVEEMYEAQPSQDDPKYTNNKQVREEMQAFQTERISESKGTSTEQQLEKDKVDYKYDLV